MQTFKGDYIIDCDPNPQGRGVKVRIHHPPTGATVVGRGRHPSSVKKELMERIVPIVMKAEDERSAERNAGRAT